LFPVKLSTYAMYVFLGTKVHSVLLVEDLWFDEWWLHMYAWILFMTDYAICMRKKL